VHVNVNIENLQDGGRVTCRGIYVRRGDTHTNNTYEKLVLPYIAFPVYIVDVTINILVICYNLKVNLSRYSHAVYKGERKYIYNTFLASALDGVNGRSQAPAAPYRRRKYLRYSLGKGLDGPQSWSGHRGQ
jgi:hypothetical protein